MNWQTIQLYSAVGFVQILSKAVTASVLNAIGDLLCQTIVEKTEKINLRRLAIFATMVSVAAGVGHQACAQF